MSLNLCCTILGLLCAYCTIQESVKSVLLQAVGTDPSRLVRIAVASLIAKLAKSLFAGEGWQEVNRSTLTLPLGLVTSLADGPPMYSLTCRT